MENEQIHVSQQSAHLMAWIDYLCQPPFSSATFDAAAKLLIQQLLEAMQEGNSCIPASAEQTALLHHLVLDRSQQAQGIAPFIFENQQLYLYRYWQLEQAVATQIARIKSQAITPVNLSERDHNLLTDPQQKQALEMVAKQGLNIITGGPGTGKTYTLAHMIAVLHEALPNIRIAMAAPTGKAAQRMQEALQKALHSEKLQAFELETLKQVQPVTLHRLLGLGRLGRPRFHAKQPLPYDVIVVDEASMLDLSLSQMLLAAVPDSARLILLGDADQLASVDVGTVLADLQQTSVLADNWVNLITTRRFASGARIGAMAHFIQQEHVPASVLNQFEQQVVAASELQVIALDQVEIDQLQLQYLPEINPTTGLQLDPYYDQLMYGYQAYADAIKQAQDQTDFEQYVQQAIQHFDHYRILTAIRHGDLGLNKINQQIEQRFLASVGKLKQGDWYTGRPVMMTYNDYQLGLSNGDIGICFWREQEGQSQFEVYFPSLEKWVLATRLPKSIETAFALTIHKSQGSEFTHTAVVLDQQAKNLLSKELIYTAITRAKKVVSLLVDRDAFTQALCVRTTRISGLSEKILEQCNNVLAKNK
ncbi:MULTISPECIES: exodeoxyribonuclease V subunit alpha [Acinetobacter]|uniref:exodeoxyribonuclease V subunit alpha n=1 Tax=Acinetobacter TaxID=469 RepID=UPI000CDCCDBD|nr:MULTISPECIES: exodeoxyribonuclease V subunit alpha [Acinetobacter]AUX90645.1 exodeoxyribonuclease V subunit alpha [Acinetobacter sp. ACNIH1]HAB44118.1 exodeoxyribonuclease V subunit alpha [Acinetobacter sp.]